jgi:hypothetical protein
MAAHIFVKCEQNTHVSWKQYKYIHKEERLKKQYILTIFLQDCIISGKWG